MPALQYTRRAEGPDPGIENVIDFEPIRMDIISIQDRFPKKNVLEVIRISRAGGLCTPPQSSSGLVGCWPARRSSSPGVRVRRKRATAFRLNSHREHAEVLAALTQRYGLQFYAAT